VAVELPKGVRAVWDLEKAHREATATRERVCINGLWRFRPADDEREAVPPDDGEWGYFKVPGTWVLGGGRSEVGRSQTLYAPESWRETLKDADRAWYVRRVTVPADWTGRRIAVRLEWVNSHARILVDGRDAGEIVFPGGECDLTDAMQPGRTHELAILASARPISPKGDYIPYDEAPQQRRMMRRGLCGDAYLTGTPRAERITHVSVDPSVRRGTLTVTAALEGLDAAGSYVLRARVIEGDGQVLQAVSDAFTAADLEARRFSFSTEWTTAKLWDLTTPENQYDLEVDLVQADRTLDAYHRVRFGFREFWVEGNRFMLNGTRINLRALPLNSAQNNTATASYEGACETMRRFKAWGYDAAYTHNYDCRPGSHLAFEQILRAADDVGFLLSFSLPHSRDYDWEGEQAEKRNGYERHLEWYVSCAQNHPSVVMYSQNHNALAYADDENPLRLPLVLDCVMPEYLAARLRDVYARDAILRQFDRTRVQYNHSGPSPSTYTLNCYLNWVPMQERSEWFQRWSEYGARPLYVVEYGEPLYFSYSTERGPWSHVRSPDLRQHHYTEWAAAIRGDDAFELSEFETLCLRWEAEQFRLHKPFVQYAHGAGHLFRDDIPNIRGVQATYIAGTWPYIRTLGLGGFNIWHEGNLARFRKGAVAERLDYPQDWDALQQPGFRPDFCDASPGDCLFYSLATDFADWEPNIRGAAFRRYNRPLLAYIGGPPERFTARAHNYGPGETVEKHLIVCNDSRATVECTCEWSVNLPGRPAGVSTVRVPTGENRRVLVRFPLPRVRTHRTCTLRLKATFSTGEVQEDEFTLHVLPARKAPMVKAAIALYDPPGETAKLLDELGVEFRPVQTADDLSGCELLVIGKKALTVDGAAPDLSRVPAGLNVVMFEQTKDVLEHRLGFRVQEHGFRRAFPRVPDHPVLDGLSAEHLRDWRGEATLVPPTMPLGELITYPQVKWCGFDTPRAGRAGCCGNVSSVMIEKPAAGDFLPLLDGGFNLQYSPLMVYREGRGMVVFCQVDVTGRTATDPAAARLAANLLEFAGARQASRRRTVVYAGEPEGLAHLKAAGTAVEPYGNQPLSDEHVLVLGPGAAEQVGDTAAASAWLRGGGRALALALDGDAARRLLPWPVAMEVGEHIACRFDPVGADSPLAGVGCGETMIRDPRKAPLVTGGAEPLGDGVLALAGEGRAVLCQLAPWHFDYKDMYNTKAAFRHLSFAVSRVLGNMGVALETPLLAHAARPAGPYETRWLNGLYLDEPVRNDDDVYRFFRW